MEFGAEFDALDDEAEFAVKEYTFEVLILKLFPGEDFCIESDAK